MILQVLKILSTELETFLDTFSGESSDSNRVVIGNIAFHEIDKYQPNSVDTSTDDKIVMTLVKVEEEPSLRNTPHYTRNVPDSTFEYHNPKVVVNLFILLTCNSILYENAITYLSRVIRFFQSKNVFTQDNTIPITSGINALDRFDDFKIMLDLHSPTVEESNHLWSMLGGKQLPSVMYKIRVLDLEFRRVSETTPRVEEIHIIDDATNETVIVTKEEPAIP